MVDVSSSSAVGELMNEIRAKFGGHVPSVVVCAAGNALLDPIVDTSEEDFDSLVSVHLKVPMLFALIAIVILNLSK